MRAPTLLVIRRDHGDATDPRIRVDGTTWSLQEEGLEGWDGVEYDVSTSDYAMWDGSYLMNERSPTRDRTVTMLGRGDQAARRSEAERFFRSRAAYEVHVYNGANRRYAAGRLYKLTIGVDNWTGWARVTFTLLCLEPYLLAEDELVGDIARSRPRFGFAFRSPRWRIPGSGHAPGYAAERHVDGFVCGIASRYTQMYNTGAAPANPRIVMTTTLPAAKPRFNVDQDGHDLAWAGYDGTLRPGEAFVVDFAALPTRATVGDASVINRMLGGSQMVCEVAPGTFGVTWNADSNDAAMSVRVYLRARYVTI